MKIKLSVPVIVEGKYDKIKLDSVIDGVIITTDGFGIFKDKDKRAYIKRMCENGVIIATDSDGAGQLIRGHIKGLIPPDKITNVYIPQTKGKEKRKKSPSAEGFLGLEGTDAEILRKLFSPYEAGSVGTGGADIKPADLYGRGYAGTKNCTAKRKALCRYVSLPESLSTKALCEALNALYTQKELDEIFDEVDKIQL